MPTASAAAQRHIPLHGCSNCRDLGGYSGHQGQRLRWGQVYRSDHLADLSAADLAQLDALGVARAVDFRGAQERAQHGYDWPQLQQHSLVRIYPNLEIMPSSHQVGPRQPGLDMAAAAAAAAAAGAWC